jgi:hypothetical protein
MVQIGQSFCVLAVVAISAGRQKSLQNAHSWCEKVRLFHNVGHTG